VTHPHSPAERFAHAIAERLDAVVPRPVRVRADGTDVAVYVGDAWWGSSLTGDLLAQTDDEAEAGEAWPLAERVETAALGVLSSVQDTVAESSREPWPRLPTGAMALPAARVQAGEVRLWCGPDEATAVLTLPPLMLRDFGDPAT
jgi:hypothetical protein